MGLFGRKKKEVSAPPLGALPEFPQFPDLSSDESNILPKRDAHDTLKPGLIRFPSQEQTVSPWQVAVAPVFIPRRDPGFLNKEPVYQQRQAAATPPPTTFDPENIPFTLDRQQIARTASAEQERSRDTSRQSIPIAVEGEETNAFAQRDQQPRIMEDKPVFVKLEKYRDVMVNVEMLKQKIKETEYLLERIEEIRVQEQVELTNCYANLNKIKEKLITIDKKLFEV